MGAALSRPPRTLGHGVDAQEVAHGAVQELGRGGLGAGGPPHGDKEPSAIAIGDILSGGWMDPDGEEGSELSRFSSEATASRFQRQPSPS
jgi:hypothetical protein